MPFTESLLHHNANDWDGHLPYRTGNWLASLPADDLERLSTLLEELVLEGPKPHHDDVLLCAIKAAELEKFRILSSEDIDEIFQLAAHLAGITSMEQLRRHGWIEFDTGTSINPDHVVNVNITDLGWENQDQFKMH